MQELVGRVRSRLQAAAAVLLTSSQQNPQPVANGIAAASARCCHRCGLGTGRAAAAGQPQCRRQLSGRYIIQMFLHGSGAMQAAKACVTGSVLKCT